MLTRFCFNFANIFACFLGLAGFATFKSEPRGQEANSFLLEWSSESNTPIQEFELTWRKDGGDWEGFTVPSYKQNDFNWAGKHAFVGLSTATRYEAKISAKNAEGWSRLSPSYHFATFGAGKCTYDLTTFLDFSQALRLSTMSCFAVILTLP